ncbi:MAG: hypothetical protein Q7J86_16170, partial [Bacteroidota bacterium]|nr:hypothetical protein [Bacteroidota bacterium]
MKISTVPLFYTRAKKDDAMLTREIAIKQATDFVLDCFKYGISIEKAILFGSVAKNELREYS